MTGYCVKGEHADCPDASKDTGACSCPCHLIEREDTNVTTYQIVRFHENDNHPNKVIVRGLTLRQAQAWCRNPQSNSRTATSKKVLGYANEFGPWHDGYEQEMRA